MGFSAILRDALEHRLKREGYVSGIDQGNKLCTEYTTFPLKPPFRVQLGWIPETIAQNVWDIQVPLGHWIPEGQHDHIIKLLYNSNSIGSIYGT